jgi:predicted TIM-barrel fold metal-dependent hydrolase
MPVNLFDAHAYVAETALSQSMADRMAIEESMKRHGIAGTALISGLSATCDFIDGNNRLREILGGAQGTLYGYATLNVEFPTESLEEQRKYLGRPEFIGAVLFGRPGSPVNKPDTEEIMNGQRRYGKATALYVPDAEAVHAAAEIAAGMPTMKFLFLTMGGADWRSAVAAAKRHVNIYLEISGQLDADKVDYAASVLTARKLVYGSGSPYGDPSLTIGLVDEARSLTSHDRSRVLSLNATTALFSIQSGE